MKIRKAKKSDLKQIIDIFKTAYSEEPYNEKWTLKTATIRIKESFKKFDILIAEEGKKIPGFVIFTTFNWEKGKTGIIEDLVVKKEFRSKGIGKILMKKAEDELKKKKVKEIWLQANPKAKVFNFYKKKEYKENGLITLTREV